MKVSLAALLGAALVDPAAAWGCLGHMITAAIAYDSITANTKAAVDPIITYLADQYPKSGPDMTQTACWADDLKSTSQIESPLHFIDLPIIEKGAPANVPIPANSSVVPWAIGLTAATLGNSASTDLDRARALRFLVHFAGDIHQPLHAAEMYSAAFPDGDLGGNYFKVSVPGFPSITNLHYYWDGGATQWTANPWRPLNSTGAGVVQSWVKLVEDAYPPSSFGNELKVTDPYAWATESNDIAGTFTYTAPQAPTAIPAAYTAQAKTLTQQRVALGGYRLGLLLDSIFSGTDGGEYARAVSAAFLGPVDPRDAPEEQEERARPASLRGAAAATA